MSCDCWNEKNSKLREKGYQISGACTMLQVEELDLITQRGLPLLRADGKKLKRGDPKMITMSFCPFCGTKFK